MKAKDASLWAKIAAAAIMILGSTAVGLGWLKMTVWDIAGVAFTVMGIFGTIDINIALDKVFGKRTATSSPVLPGVPQ